MSDAAPVSENANAAVAAERLNPSPRWYRAIVALVAVVVAVWVGAMCVVRFQGAFDPWRAETDAKQVTHRFYAYSDLGTLPDGELLEEYARIYSAPPIYNTTMAALSTVFDAKDAAVGLNIAIFLGILALLVYAGHKRGEILVGLAAVVLFAHAEIPWKIIAGGHPRSFAPLLTVLFLVTLITKDRRLMLVTLVLQGGIYPSPLLACGPAAAVVVAWDFWRDRKFKPVVAFAVASIVALGLAKLQDLRSPPEWGEIITYEQAVKHPAWKSGSRFPYTPLPPPMRHPQQALDQLVAKGGSVAIAGVSGDVVWYFWAGLGLVGVVALLRRRGQAPWPEVLLLAACLGAHFLARHLAFKLHIPHRAVAHGWPVVLSLLVPWGAYLAGRAFGLQRAAGALAFACTAGVVLLVSGTGLQDPKVWRDYKRDADLYTWLRNETPKDAIFAGNFQIMDETPLFGHRRVYVNWKLAHPYRLGYFDIVQKRTSKMYAAYYATTLEDVVRFGEETGVDYMIVDASRFKTFEKGDGQLFEPLRSAVRPMFERCQKQACALNPPPPEAVVFRSKRYAVVEIARLRGLKPPLAPVVEGPDDEAPEPAAD